MKKIVITGGAGYIGSLLTGKFIDSGYEVAVIDKLLFGGDHMLCYNRDQFSLHPYDIMDMPDGLLSSICSGADAVVHLAALVGFPACQQVGPSVSKRYNVDTTKKMFDIANAEGVERFVFASTYSNYGKSSDGKPVTEESPLNPQSIYAENKIESEELLLNANTDCKPLVLRLSTLFGASPRTRFDLIVNQFVLEALTHGKIIIYQKNYRRSFCHVYDVILCMHQAIAEWDLDSYDDVWNVGSNQHNMSKEEVISLIKSKIPLEVEYKDLSFGGDMRDITVSFDKIISKHGFEPKISVMGGIREIKQIIQTGLVKNPFDDKYRNAKFIVS